MATNEISIERSIETSVMVDDAAAPRVELMRDRTVDETPFAQRSGDQFFFVVVVTPREQIRLFATARRSSFAVIRTRGIIFVTSSRYGRKNGSDRTFVPTSSAHLDERNPSDRFDSRVSLPSRNDSDRDCIGIGR